ncbi:MAG TPA: arginase [Firmicutes bacterium]|uniref:arginase n=1 Tax=Gelria sp. Kuro-4 TaxID=2796927 RepID=UPI001998A027|nr:arginase [Gelria sp. Kuro-4]MDI3522111.1 arginase [Bacillota bacterium]BCV24320.1 arginase [Gelria sp. Kuro-4]HHV56895.1 arginase [Bacillota bacterium]
MRVQIIGVPQDLGANRRGVDMGPSAIRYAGVRERLESLGYTVQDRGNIPVSLRDERTAGDTRLRYLPEIQQTSELLAQTVREAVEAGDLPLVLGGDHSIAIGTLAGVAAVKECGVIWIDAHGDFNTPETTASGNIHGMPLAASLGRGDERLVSCGGFVAKAKEKNVALIGARDLDPEERDALRRSRISVFTMQDIDEMGMKRVMQQAVAAALDGTEGIAVSLDMDALDPLEAPGVGTPVRGGLTYREAHLAMELIAETGALLSLEVVEVNPILDYRNQTAELAVELIASALGKKII